MPVRKPNLNPPFNIVRASHVEFGVRDIARTRAFYVDCLGYLVTDETRTDAALGCQLGMPRDLDGDGLATNTNVSGTALLIPVVVRARWSGSRGNQAITHGFYLSRF